MSQSKNRMGNSSYQQSLIFALSIVLIMPHIGAIQVAGETPQKTPLVSPANEVSLEPQLLLYDNYKKCQFWIDQNWFDLSDLQTDATYRGYQKSQTQNGIDFNFCKTLENSVGTFCPGDFYAGTWTTGSSGITCLSQLTGSSADPEASIKAKVIPDADLNAIGITLQLEGSRTTSDYVLINVYCNRDVEDVQWDNTYLPHTDTSGIQYYQITMTSQHGCSAMQTDRYWQGLGGLKYVFAFLGLFGGLLVCMAGRLLLTYVVFILVIAATIAIANFLVFTIAGEKEISSFVFWITFVTSSICGLLLAWASTKYRAGGATILAGWTGFEIGVAFANLVYFQMQSLVVFWLIVIIGVIVMAAIAITKINQHMIWITAIFGSYTFIISFSLFVGRWPIDLNLPELVDAGAVAGIEPYFFLYMGIWLSMSCIGVITQCYTLWYFKKSGKQLKPKLQEAVDKFEYGRTAEEIKKDKERKTFEQYIANQIDENTEHHDSIYLDLESRHRSASQDSNQLQSLRTLSGKLLSQQLLGQGKNQGSFGSGSSQRSNNQMRGRLLSDGIGSDGRDYKVAQIEEATQEEENNDDSPYKSSELRQNLLLNSQKDLLKSNPVGIQEEDRFGIYGVDFFASEVVNSPKKEILLNAKQFSVKKLKPRQQSVKEPSVDSGRMSNVRSNSGKYTSSSIQNEDMSDDDDDEEMQIPISVTVLSPHAQHSAASQAADYDSSPINTEGSNSKLD